MQQLHHEQIELLEQWTVQAELHPHKLNFGLRRSRTHQHMHRVAIADPHQHESQKQYDEK